MLANIKKLFSKHKELKVTLFVWDAGRGNWGLAKYPLPKTTENYKFVVENMVIEFQGIIVNPEKGLPFDYYPEKEAWEDI